MGRNSSRLHLMSIKVCRLLSSCEEVLMGHRVLFPKRIAYMRKDCVTSPWRVARDHCTGTIIFLSRGGWKISNENKLLSKKKLFKESHVGKIEQVRSTIQVLFNYSWFSVSRHFKIAEIGKKIKTVQQIKSRV